jgi:C1A family cysteine protease
MSHSYGLVHDSHDDRDFRFSRLAATRLGLAPLPPSVDLRSFCSPVRDQLNIGSCTGFALATGFRECLLRQIRAQTVLSPLWLYFEERKREHSIRRDRGARLRDGMRVLAGMGCAPESDWPYDPAKFATVPPYQAMLDAVPNKIGAYYRVNGLIELKQALALKHPVVIGIEVWSSFDSDDVARTGIVPLPNQNAEEMLGGHALCVVGYDDGTARLTVKNSWGTSWGAAGYCYLPYGYMDPAQNLLMDSWTGAA